MARAQVRLLGPCFKTGQVDNSLSNAAKASFVLSLNQLTPHQYQQPSLFKIKLPIQNERATRRTHRLLYCNDGAMYAGR
jgi:hypothetical protein